MALAQILAQHSRDLTATINHQNSVEQDNVDRKANDLEEKFQHAKDAIEGAGGEITALSGAYHLGRKIYKKVQEKRAQLKQNADNPTEGEGDSRATDASTNSGAPEPEGQESGGTESSSGQQARESQVAEESQPDSQPKQPEREDPSQESAGAGEEAEIEDPDTIMGGKGAYQLGDDDAIPGTASKQPSGDLARNLASDDSPETTIAKTEGVDDKVGELADADVPGDAENLSANIGKDDLMSGVRNVGKRIASKFLSTGAEGALEGGLETAGLALDAVPVVGEIAGVITGLVGLFEGLKHKKKEVEQTGQEATTGSTQVQAGIDTSALTEQAKQTVGVQV